MIADPLWLQQLLDREVHERIAQDHRTVAARHTFLGWPRDKIFWDVIGGGQADFDAPVGHLTGEDRALLYAKYNQSRHLDELGHAFDLLFTKSGKAVRPTVIDLGCGPFTAGLALAAVLGPAEAFRYYGIDRAVAMRSLGQRLANSAQADGGIHLATTYWFGDDLNQVDFGPVRGDLTVVVASYLLASPTLDVNELVASVLYALQRIGPGPTAILYTNSASANATAKYASFRDALCLGGFEVMVDTVELFTATRNPKDVHYALLFRPATTTISVKRPLP